VSWHREGADIACAPEISDMNKCLRDNPNNPGKCEKSVRKKNKTQKSMIIHQFSIHPSLDASSCRSCAVGFFFGVCLCAIASALCLLTTNLFDCMRFSLAETGCADMQRDVPVPSSRDYVFFLHGNEKERQFQPWNM
jgi:hypothetical protein